MTGLPDPRRTPYRRDLAAAHLKGVVDAPRFAEGTPHRVRVGRAPLRTAPDLPRATTEILFGETFTVYDAADGWAWGQNGTDDYVGWVRADALEAGEGEAPTHKVAALSTFLYPLPDMKEPPLGVLPLTAACAVVEERGGFARLACGGWAFAKHLAPVDAVLETDPVATAERMLGAPYLWGGRTPMGIDCSGLAQIALACAGIAAPRDSDMQRGEVGEPVPAGEAPRRGDLVFFPGHVALMRDAATLVHATAFTMTVTVEALEAVIARTDPTRGGGLLGVRRPAARVSSRTV